MNGRTSTRRQDFLALLLLLAGLLWFSHEMLWEGQIPFYRDLGPYFYPLRFSLAQSFQAGELPLWDRHMAMGFPLLADFQSGAFYLPHLFYFILPFFAALRVTFLFHYLVAASGSYILCRRWDYPPYLSLIGAILFTFGGMLVSLTNLLNHFQTAVWLPWVIFLGEKVVRSCRWKDFLAFTLASLLQFLAGSPEIYAMSMGLLSLDLLRVRSEKEGMSYWRVFLLPVAANVLILGLAMIQILPTMELFQVSRGSIPVQYKENVTWSLHPLNVINLFFLDKEINTYVGNGVHLFFLQDIPLLLSHYIGVISLLGVLIWLFYVPRKEKVVLLGVIIASLVLAAGRYTPVYPFLFQHAPFFNLFRFPEKFFFLTYAMLLFIALRGLFYLVQSNDSSSRGPLLILWVVYLILFVFYLFLRFDTAALSRFIAWSTHSPLLSTSTLGLTSAALVNLERQMALLFGILLLLLLWKKARLRTTLSQGLIVGLAFVDLASAHRPYQFFLDPNFIYQGSRIIKAPDPEPSRLFYYAGDSNLHPSYYRVLRQLTFAELHPLIFNNVLPNTGILHEIDYMQEIDALMRWPYVFFLDFANKLPAERLYLLLGALNVKYINSFQPLADAKALTLIRHFPEHPSWLYKIDRTVPRAYVVSKVTEEKNPLQILTRLSSAQFNPLEEVILDQAVPVDGKRSFRGRAAIVKYGNSYVAVRAFLNNPGVLVLADSFYPGWQVSVDGNESKILRANFFFRAVSLPAGEHLVEFRYRPASFTIGLAISLATLCGVVLCSVIFSLRKTKKPESGTP